jgi:hypothetical protein
MQCHPSQLFNWTYPYSLPDAVYAPLKGHDNATLKKRPNASLGLQPQAAPYNEQYQLFNMVDATLATMHWLGTDNLTSWTQERPDLQHVVMASNRGATCKLANNPYHSDDFWKMGLRPENAFMCGFWALCQPNKQVQRLYACDVWAPLADPHSLKIGIQVLFGDEVVNNDAERGNNLQYISSLLSLATPFFECAAAIESAYSVPGQQVVWYLM